MTYTVREGDCLSGIAQRLGLEDWRGLYQNNKATIGGNPDLIKTGQQLLID
jgi:nucleoid-associated protein YgaU